MEEHVDGISASACTRKGHCLFLRLADSSGTHIGFIGRMNAHTALLSLEIQKVFPADRCLVWPSIRHVKTALHISARNFREIFVAEDAALLTQGKDDKAKSAE